MATVQRAKGAVQLSSAGATAGRAKGAVQVKGTVGETVEPLMAYYPLSTRLVRSYAR